MKLRNIDIRKLNSLTKYPSIQTYHLMGDRGQLAEACAPPPPPGDVVATEKIDGVNARIVVLPGRQFLVGSREEFLHAGGDVLSNPAMGIVGAVGPLVPRLIDALGGDDLDVTVCVYGEVFGGKTTAAAKEYARAGEVGFRVFDASTIKLLDFMLGWDLDEIAAWRDGGGQDFMPQHGLADLADLAGLRMVPTVWSGSVEALGKSIEETYAFLSAYRESRACMDALSGRSEGVVVRSPDRGWIYKLRHEDYDRTIRRRERR